MQTQEKGEVLTPLRLPGSSLLAARGLKACGIPQRLEEEGMYPERPLKGFVGEGGPLGLVS